jgi:ketosteroid isomerase-like protein
MSVAPNRRALCVGLVVVGLPWLLATATLSTREHTLAAFLRENDGVAYQYGACHAQAMDCSCFVQRLYADRFARPIPRSTLSQAQFLNGSRVPSLARPEDLDGRNLCAGDLIYTYGGVTWTGGPRHVAIYAGRDQIVHSASALNGVGTSPLAWVRQFRLHGVFRPLGCTGSPQRPPPTHTPRADDGKDVREVVRRYFESRRQRDAKQFIGLWSPDAQQWSLGQHWDLAGIVARQRREWQEVRDFQARYDVRSLAIWGDQALVEVVYDAELRYRSFTHYEEGIRESFLLRRFVDAWRIVHSETYGGD